jgi:hypothetical protein
MPKKTKKLLMLTPHKMSWGMVIYQEWMPMFNPNFLHGLKIHVWCLLKTLSLECRPFNKTSVTHVKNILGENLNNHKKKDLKFCITMDPK